MGKGYHNLGKGSSSCKGKGILSVHTWVQQGEMGKGYDILHNLRG